MVVVDYLQLMAPRDRRVPREQQVGEMSEGLKSLAKELRVPVVALAQVNRGPADRNDKRPMMSDLRESGRIEADADHIWLLHRQDLVEQNSTTGEIEVIVAKNRNGVAGRTVVLRFQGQYSRAVQRAWSPTKEIA
jgi:replicative DNA helicase